MTGASLSTRFLEGSDLPYSSLIHFVVHVNASELYQKEVASMPMKDRGNAVKGTTITNVGNGHTLVIKVSSSPCHGKA